MEEKKRKGGLDEDKHFEISVRLLLLCSSVPSIILLPTIAAAGGAAKGYHLKELNFSISERPYR